MKEAGYKVEVSHRITVSGTMTATIIRKVYECDLAIANLTGNNPNVMYEIGLRHAAAKPIIHITEDVKDLAFDVTLLVHNFDLGDQLIKVGDLRESFFLGNFCKIFIQIAPFFALACGGFRKISLGVAYDSGWITC